MTMGKKAAKLLPMRISCDSGSPPKNQALGHPVYHLYMMPSLITIPKVQHDIGSIGQPVITSAEQQTMTITNPALLRLLSAHEALQPHVKHGSYQDAPAALQCEYANAILGVPKSFLDALERLQPGEGSAMLAWAQSYIERLDYPDFFAALADMERIHAEKGEAAAESPEHLELFIKMMRAAPPRHRSEAEAILSDMLPAATHVDDHGQPVYSIQQVANKLGIAKEEVEANIQQLADRGLINGPYQGSAHPIH